MVPEPALRSTVLGTVLTVAPLRVRVPLAPAVVLLLPMRRFRLLRALVISMAPAAWFLVPLLVVLLKLIPTPVVPLVGLAANWAMSVVPGTASPVQLVPVSQAEPAPELQRIWPWAAIVVREMAMIAAAAGRLKREMRGFMSVGCGLGMGVRGLAAEGASRKHTWVFRSR